MPRLLSAVLDSVESAWLFNADQQRWLRYFPGAPDFASTFTTIDRFDAPAIWSIAPIRLSTAPRAMGFAAGAQGVSLAVLPTEV